MKPLLSILVAILLLIVGLIPLGTMLSVQGRKIENPRRQLIWHKITGYSFASLALFMFVMMVWRARAYWLANSPVVALHVTLAFSFLLLLMLKIVTARYYKHFGGRLFSLGVVVYLLAFALIGLAASHHMVWRLRKKAELTYGEAPVADTGLGKELLVSRCSGCHPLSDVLRPRSAEAWKEDVGRMLERSHSILTVDEANLILQYLIENMSPRTVPASAGAAPLEKFCLPCHELTEVLGVRRSREEWQVIVTKMHSLGPDIIPAKNIDEIVRILLREQEGAALSNTPESDRR
jgi:hypothetical protein